MFCLLLKWSFTIFGALKNCVKELEKNSFLSEKQIWQLNFFVEANSYDRPPILSLTELRWPTNFKYHNNYLCFACIDRNTSPASLVPLPLKDSFNAAQKVEFFKS